MSRLSSAPAGDDDPVLNPMLSASAFDFLLTELVPMTYRIHADLAARDEQLATQASLLHLFPARKNKRRNAAGATSSAGAGTERTTAGGIASTDATASGGSASGAAGGVKKDASASNGPGSTGGRAGAGTTTAGGVEEGEDEAAREAVFYRLDALGYRVGQGLAERFAADQPRPATHLDSIKFICKDLWTRVFRKQIDNLKTNHRGTFVLTDSRFAPLTRMSPDRALGVRAADVALHRAQAFLWFPCGVIRGALAGLGMNVTVNAETTVLPIATFQIRLVGAQP